jgi:hypothetical protein
MKLEAVAAPPVGRHRRFTNGSSSARIAPVTLIATHTKQRGGGNSPNDRMLRGPDCNRPKRVCADSFPATPPPQFPRTRKIPERRFLRQAESIGPMWPPNQLHPRPECRLPLVGPRAPVKERDGRSALCSSSAMSSDRLFLDRVARQHCPSPLHRRAQTNMHPLPARPKPDISTLQRIGHFYFALTPARTDPNRSISQDLKWDAGQRDASEGPWRGFREKWAEGSRGVLIAPGGCRQAGRMVE